MALQNVHLHTESALARPDLVDQYECPSGNGMKVGRFLKFQKNGHVGFRCKISYQRLKTEADWSVAPTRILRGDSIASNAAIICGIAVGRFALGDTVATRDVPDYAIVAGAPAKVVCDVRDCENVLTTATGMAAL